MVVNYITEENIISHFEYIYTPKKLESHLTNFIVYDLETHNTDRTRHYVFCFYRLSKLAGKYNHDSTPYEIGKWRNDTVAFCGDNCVSKTLDFFLKIEGEERKLKNLPVEYNLQLHAHNGSGFGIWVILKNLDSDKHIDNIIKNSKGTIKLKVFNGWIEKISPFPQYLLFRCGRTHLIYSL